jgi:cell division protein FtsB
MKWLMVALLTALLAIQYRLWISRDGVNEMMQMREAVGAQRDENAKLKQRNEQLAAEVRDLKQGFGALEERARSDLGLVLRNETYYQVVPKSEAPEPVVIPPAQPPTRTAAR